jgi:hypothetical protein
MISGNKHFPETMVNKSVIILNMLLVVSLIARPQDKENHVTLKGYLSSLQSTMFDSLSGPFTNENLLHNRLNFKGFMSNDITFSIELRNRLFTGDLVRLGKYYSGLIGADYGWVDMSWNVIERQSFLLNTTVDRLWIDFHYGNFQVTAGRQRINWGQAFVWNPNDIFNTYSFFDFDYVEKPGSDAARLQYFPSSSSAAELAVKVDRENDVTAAGLYRFNKWNYDFQFLTGIVKGEDFVIGTGWSGAIRSLSFRGEASWFNHYGDSPGDKNTVLATTSFDKILKDNSMAQVQIMYCNHPLILNDFKSFYSGNLSPKDIAFSRFSIFGQFTWAATPLLNAGISAMWFPDLKGYFAGPSVDYSLAENLDFSLIWQHFNCMMGTTRTNINLGFLRLKFSF